MIKKYNFNSLFLGSLVALACAVAAPVAHASFDHSKWNALLGKHVIKLRNGQATQVNYAQFSKSRDALKTYLQQISSVPKKDFDRWGKKQQLAFLINAYNAWTIELVLDHYPKIKSIKDIGGFFSSPWKKKFIPLLGKTRSLDDIEHKLIRGSGRYNEPRIHFAVNCASIGCPALRAEAYTAPKLEQQLEAATRAFLSDRTRNYLDRTAENTMKVSMIFKWYRGDFKKGWLGAKNLGEFLTRYKDTLALNPEEAQQLATGKINIQFLDYDWRLNKLRK